MHSTQLYYCIIVAVNMMVGTADVFTVYLFELNTSCLLKQVYSDGSSRQGFLENVYNITIDECIYQCFCKSSGTLCNLIQYIEDIKRCTLYNDNGRKLLKNSNNEQSNVPMLFVFKCEPGYQSSLTDTFSRNHFALHTLYSAKSEIWGLTCLLEQRDLELSHRAHFLGISYGSLESCVFTCNAYASVTSCNAVSEYNNSCSYYNFKVREPPLQNSTAYTSGITIIHLCFTSINRNIKEASVHLFRYFELCTVRSFPIRSLDNLFILRRFYDIRSFHMCLNLCREVITSWPYRAVVYSKKSQKCAVLGSGIGYETGKLCENLRLGQKQYHLNLKMHLAHLYWFIIIAVNMMLFTEPDENTLPVIHILNCDEGYENSLSKAFPRNSSAINPLFFIKSEEFDEMCLLEMRYVESNFESTFLGNSIGSLETCVFTCHAFAASSSCNAVIHGDELCSHYYFEVKKPPPRSPPVKSLSLIILHLCLENDLHVSSYDVQYEDDLYYLLTPFPFPIKRNNSMNGTKLFVKAIESAVRLFKYYELCILRTFPINNLDSIFPLKRFYGVSSFISCLHICRQTISTWPYRAVAYIKSDKLCTIFGSGVGHKGKALEKNLQITELRQCTLDRAEERLNNPPPLKYFFEETSDICFVELNTLNYSNYFTVIQQTQNVESFMQCLRNCRKALLQCTAIDYTTRRQCSFLKRISHNGTFRKNENSVFAELLYCEIATITDLINDF
ncbi:hypothetical protein T05_1263 [Trichinella murrelli]|uniref:Apple domain-containing protein n=1 Tax=Trichinella murrelli TaxID=144512 RepID=A0A0V0TFM2_9BILA|nr:hypothetical protein T05_1263 [Trichinella murrelli]